MADICSAILQGCTDEVAVGTNTFKVEDLLKEEQLLFPDTDDGQIALVSPT